jgi:hypothetical protein
MERKIKEKVFHREREIRVVIFPIFMAMPAAVKLFFVEDSSLIFSGANN